MLAASVMITACNKSETITGGSACIKSQVKEFRRGDVCSGSASVKQYTFQNQQVYVFDQGTCGADYTQAVLNENCEIIGYLGGIAGNGTINGENFCDNATYVSTIWSN
ncbi:MAG: hypothetical protein BGO31_19665 [Bacteroidetes bacterium 43-16]|nr:MAG: hypothetical protein BGO31_19665 [Bacteroidetes bacterium 43-16]